MTFEELMKSETGYPEDNIPDKRNKKYKGPEVEMCLVYLGSSKEASVGRGQ